jgi:pyruvate-ferredoxin/flavodoxin oxidoreductase
LREVGEAPFRLDSPRPTLPFKDYAYNELRYSALAASRPRGSRRACWRKRRKAIRDKYHSYEEFAQMAAGPDASKAMGAARKK